MIHLHYINEAGRTISYYVDDLEAVYNVADTLLKAPIDIEYISFDGGNRQGEFILETFTVV